MIPDYVKPRGEELQSATSVAREVRSVAGQGAEPQVRVHETLADKTVADERPTEIEGVYKRRLHLDRQSQAGNDQLRRAPPVQRSPIPRLAPRCGKPARHPSVANPPAARWQGR